MSEDNYDELWDLKWIQVPGISYLMKYKFYEDHYTFMITDLSALYGEELNEGQVEQRFCSINPYAEMKPKVILKHLKQSIKDILDGGINKMKFACEPTSVIIRMQFIVNQVYFFFDLKPGMLPGEKLRAHVIAPIVFTSLHTNEENVILKKKFEDMEKKDILVSLSHKYQEDPKIRTLCSKINNKSQVQKEDVLQSFLCMQETVNSFISKNKTVNAVIKPSQQFSGSSRHLNDTRSLPTQVSLKEESSTILGLTFDDSEENITNIGDNAHQKRPLGNEEDLGANIKSEIIKKEDDPIMDSDSNPSTTPLPVAEQSHTKSKRKKKVIKF